MQLLKQRLSCSWIELKWRILFSNATANFIRLNCPNHRVSEFLSQSLVTESLSYFAISTILPLRHFTMFVDSPATGCETFSPPYVLSTLPLGSLARHLSLWHVRGKDTCNCSSLNSGRGERSCDTVGDIVIVVFSYFYSSGRILNETWEEEAQGAERRRKTKS